MGGLNIRNRRVGGVTIMDLTGKIAIGESNRALHDALRNAAASDRKDVIVNLSGVSVIDSSGLGELVSGFASLGKAGGSMKLLNLPTRINELMTITKLHTVFEIFDDEDDAVESYHLTPEADSRFPQIH